ncbi:MAG: PilZ domain-containing protein [Candidatus Competibacteraceae bacterium]|jgi:hypothetical protein|nr:PilZ domain-containing protein [Candidatus Competibacteraceae bacterium]
MRAFIRHPTDIPIAIEASERITHAIRRLKDVSIGGLCCQSKVFLENGLLVTVKIDLVKPPFEATGRVVWCKKIHDDLFDVGIQFLEAEDVFNARMVEQVCHIENYKRKIMREEGRTLDGQSAALEWISHYAADFPGEVPPNNT